MVSESFFLIFSHFVRNVQTRGCHLQQFFFSISKLLSSASQTPLAPCKLGTWSMVREGYGKHSVMSTLFSKWQTIPELQVKMLTEILAKELSNSHISKCGHCWQKFVQGSINIYDIYVDVCVSSHAQAETRHFGKQVRLTKSLNIFLAT